MRRIHALVGRKQKSSAGIKHHLVRMRAVALLSFVRPFFARRRHGIGGGRERTIGVDRQHHNTRPVGANHIAITRINNQMRPVIAVAGLLIEKF